MSRSKKKKRKKLSLGESLIKALKECIRLEMIKSPRTGIIHTKIVPDKTKYSRKKKHKKSLDWEY